jgi:hypothetical protein
LGITVGDSSDEFESRVVETMLYVSCSSVTVTVQDGQCAVCFGDEHEILRY